ncbi:MAG TPA: sulfite exporter TauE/SafE family protein [Vicinamibacteria bacterium]|nr:sulfite exporter TauE/SafE family protein [Vicinamibacteria bacterium]
MKTALFVLLGLFATGYLLVLAGAARRARAARAAGADGASPSVLELAVGFVTNFFDTLGIGSFAPTTAVFKLKNLVPDELIPGTLNVGHTLPAVVQAFIFIAIVKVDVWTLTLMIGAAVAGSWIGAGVVAGWPRRYIQVGMGGALLVAATFYVLTIFGIAPGGGEALSLSGVRLAVGLSVNFLLGALMQLGVGLYGPCLILISLLGMNPQAAFPIMMGSCAFLMPIGSVKFIRRGRFSLRASLGLLVGGVPAVLIAAFIVKSMPLAYLRWLVVVVVLYASFSMLRSAHLEVRGKPPAPAA